MYCSNCGHQLKEGQSFCNQCGAHIRQSYQNHPPHYNQNHSNYNVQRASRSKKPTGLIILLSLIFIGFIAAMLYGAYYAYEHYVKDDDKTSESVQSSPSNTNDSKSEQDSTSKGPHIDVFSTAFDKGYMKSASTSGYQGIYTGMTRKEVEEKFGKSDGNVDSSNYTYEKYGNLAVAYENDEVVHVGVAPNDISEDQFIQKYNEPDDRKPNQLIYDSNKDNDFSVLVNVKNGKISVIENVDQL
ncbi:zinc ribbon domain-containing protein [Staphylococcus capitis]|uniref:zinc ribbon domain-containing protein n=1 Tax=Staphylococcus capitis TaxID=29388 RepID=UPI0007130303|nr:zinc ribbon domain-containing protein [Staphylococcus capitis]CUT95508.1 conserved hypothetical protein [Staphylococcus capitis]